MNQYLALLRGINVSGQKAIKMASLISLCQKIGFEEVTTYIQSGNICFKSANKDIEKLTLLLQENIKQEYNFDVPVLIIKHRTLEEIYNNLPFKNIDVASEGNKVLVSFLSTQPDQEKITHLLSYVKAPEKLSVDKQALYLHCPNGYGKTKLSNNFVENKLKVTATTRNLKTIVKLIALLKV
ncbi:MAG: DUF1697 domain-containing protein [Colwelliaceae bacterium]|nr:DUF1697 domain-containing protein [Colwelliaceae bacterium]